MLIATDMAGILGGPPVRPGGPPAWPPDDPAVMAALQRAATDGAWGRYHGTHGIALRRLLCEFHGVEHAWLCSSGTAAVELALRGVGVGPGDEVILAAYDFKANFANVLALGAIPVLVDVGPSDWQLDVARVASVVSPQTKAVIASHLHGGSVEMVRLRQELANRPIAIVEDACQCPGARIGDQRAGTLGDVGVFSFGGSKLTAAGRGGALITNSGAIIERVRRHVLRGNDLSPLSELQAAILTPQWQALDDLNVRRAARVRELFDALADSAVLRMLTPPSAPSASGYYKVGFEYVGRALTRDLFCRAMRAEGVAMFPGFRSLHRIHASRRFRAAGNLSIADAVDESSIVLHHPVLLGTEADIRQIAEAVRKVCRHAAEIGSATDLLPEPAAEHE